MSFKSGHSVRLRFWIDRLLSRFAGLACTARALACAGKASGMEQAVGRVLGSLCAITARDDDAQSAMLASWISQARAASLHEHLLFPAAVQAPAGRGATFLACDRAWDHPGAQFCWHPL